MAKRHILPTVLIAIAAIVALFPIVFTVASSFMSGTEIADRYTAEITETNANDFSSSGIHFVRFGLIPEQPTLDQYKELLLNSPDYLRMFWNSVLLVVPVLIGQCVLAPLAAFGIENLRWKYKEAIYFTYIIVMLMPTQILLVPNFIVAGWLGIRENYLAIILPAMFHPLGVFLVRQQLKNFPKECLEAAQLDGAGAFQAYRYIVRPQPDLGDRRPGGAALRRQLEHRGPGGGVLKRDLRQPPVRVPGDRGLRRPGDVLRRCPCSTSSRRCWCSSWGQDYLAEGIALSGVKA